MTLWGDFLLLFMPAPTDTATTIIFYTGQLIISLVVVLGTFRLLNNIAKWISGGK